MTDVMCHVGIKDKLEHNNCHINSKHIVFFVLMDQIARDSQEAEKGMHHNMYTSCNIHHIVDKAAFHERHPYVPLKGTSVSIC